MNTLLLILSLHANLITVDAAVDTAQANHPNLVAADARVRGAQARADAAEAGLSPTVSARARFGTTLSGPFGTAVNSRTSYDMGISASYLLWDGGRTRDRAAAAGVRGDAERMQAAVTRADTISNVKLAFVEAQLRKRLVAVAHDTLASEEKRLSQVKGLVDAGSRAKIDLLRERTAVAKARSSTVRAVGDYDRARTELNRAMGVTASTEYDVDDKHIEMVSGEDLNSASLVSTAMASRPELAVLDAELAAQRLTVRSAKKGLLPALRLGADSGWGGTGFATPAWNAGVSVTLSWNIFDGGATRANTSAAEVDMVVMRSRRRGLEQQIYVEVDAARLGIRSAKESLHAAMSASEAARELLDVAEQRYSNGIGNIIELNDAQAEVSRAGADLARAHFDLSSARVRLARALGGSD